MKKLLALLVVIGLAVVIGCQKEPAKPKPKVSTTPPSTAPAAPVKEEVKKPEPGKAEGPKAEPPKAEPPKAEPPKAEPPKAPEPPKAESHSFIVSAVVCQQEATVDVNLGLLEARPRFFEDNIKEFHGACARPCEILAFGHVDVKRIAQVVMRLPHVGREEGGALSKVGERRVKGRGALRLSAGEHVEFSEAYPFIGIGEWH